MLAFCCQNLSLCYFNDDSKTQVEKYIGTTTMMLGSKYSYHFATALSHSGHPWDEITQSSRSACYFYCSFHSAWPMWTQPFLITESCVLFLIVQCARKDLVNNICPFVRYGFQGRLFVSLVIIMNSMLLHHVWSAGSVCTTVSTS